MPCALRTFWEMAGLGFGEDGLYGEIYNKKKEGRRYFESCCSMHCGCCLVSILASARANQSRHFKVLGGYLATSKWK